jgi:hypothetical protein
MEQHRIHQRHRYANRTPIHQPHDTPTALDSKAQGRGHAAHPGVPTPIRRVYPNGVVQRRRGPVVGWIICVGYRQTPRKYDEIHENGS